MSNPRAFTVRRILVALDASPSSLAALDAAADLAARMDAELLGVFVEDVRLLRLADYPYARRVRYFSATAAPVTRADLESELRAQSEQARCALAEAAQRAQIHWSFRIVRGDVTRELMAAARDVDLLAIGRCGWSSGGRPRVGSTAMGIVAGTIPVLVLSEHHAAPYAQLLVHYDGSPSARQRILAAGHLARGGAMGVSVLLATADRESAARMQREVESLLQGEGVKVRYLSIDPLDAEALLRQVRAEKAGMIVVGGRASLGKLLDALLSELDVPVLLLGDGESESEPV